MAHFPGEVFSMDTVRIGFFEFNGTVDLACTRIYTSPNERDDNWRADNMRECTCGSEPTEVVLKSGSLEWSARACLECRAIVDGREPMVENILN